MSVDFISKINFFILTKLKYIYAVLIEVNFIGESSIQS